MIEEPGWTAGRRISSRPVEGPEARRRRSFEIRVISTAKSRRALETWPAAARDWRPSRGSSIGQEGLARHPGEPRDRLLAETGRRVQAGSCRRTPEREGKKTVEGGRQREPTALDRGPVGPEFLAERDRNRVHEVCPSGLDDALELFALAGERAGELADLRRETAADREHGHVEGRGESIVRRLPEVDVVVRIDGLPVAARLAEDLGRAAGQNLVHVHVERRSRPGLVNVHDELVGEFPLFHLRAGGDDRVRLFRREALEFPVRQGAGLFHSGVRFHHLRVRAQARDRVVFDRAGGLGAPVSLFRDLALSEAVFLHSRRHGFSGSSRPSISHASRAPSGTLLATSSV